MAPAESGTICVAPSCKSKTQCLEFFSFKTFSEKEVTYRLLSSIHHQSSCVMSKYLSDTIRISEIKRKESASLTTCKRSTCISDKKYIICVQGYTILLKCQIKIESVQQLLNDNLKHFGKKIKRMITTFCFFFSLM